jgi:putative transposase
MAPALYHCHRGAQDFRETLKAYKACWYDNAAMESLFSTLKTGFFQNRVPIDRVDAGLMLFDYVEAFYNLKRLHSALGYLSPLEFEKLLNNLNLQN